MIACMSNFLLRVMTSDRPRGGEYLEPLERASVSATTSDRPWGDKLINLLANAYTNVRTGLQQTQVFLILVCLILVCSDSRWLLILYGSSNEMISSFNEETEYLDLKMLYYSIKMYIIGEWMLFFRSPIGWKLKILYFHLNFFPKYIWAHFWDWTWSCLKFLMGLALYPWIEWLEYPIYCTATMYTTFGILFATAIEHFKLWKWNLIEVGTSEKKINLQISNVSTSPT